jgi:hypothetical protein
MRFITWMTGQSNAKGIGTTCVDRLFQSTSSQRAHPALRVTTGSRESLAGRFERLTLSHWSASSLANVFQISPDEAASLIVQVGSYPGAMALRNDVERWAAYVKDATIDPAIGRDVLALGTV